jgi:hypothetical protein
VPPVFDMKELNSLPPVKKKTSAGTELTWKLKDVHNREERLVSYKIIPLFGVHGQIRLPRSRVTFKQGKREIHNNSAYASIGIATDKEEPKRKKK